MYDAQTKLAFVCLFALFYTAYSSLGFMSTSCVTPKQLFQSFHHKIELEKSFVSSKNLCPRRPLRRRLGVGQPKQTPNVGTQSSNH